MLGEIDTSVGYYTVDMMPGGESWSAVVHVKPMGKPTMTQKSKHIKAAAVKYLTEFCPTLLAGFNRAGKFQSATGIVLIAYFSNKDQSVMGRSHDQKPDLTNILKGVEDALLIDDSRIAYQRCFKYWGKEDRLEIKLYGVKFPGE